MLNKLLLAFFLPVCLVAAETKPFVEAEIRGQLGNNMFIIAAASALAWDHDADAYFPELAYKYQHHRQNIPLNLSHIFFRCNLSQVPRKVAGKWFQPSYAYHPIDFHPDMKIHGYFQSEKYFVHQREKILDLFAPHPDDLKYMQTKYPWLLEHPCAVGIQLRHQWEDPGGTIYIQYGKDYLRKAMSLFPAEALFILSSDNLEFALENIPGEMRERVIAIENEPHYIDFFLLSLCKHNIITNSTFGWWSAWLNRNPDKVVVAPELWLNPRCTHLPTHDILPEAWVKIEAKWGSLDLPRSYQ